jgi:hypothetical protein
MTLNQIIGNNEKKSKVDNNLWKKMNDKYSGIEAKTKEVTQKETISQTLKCDEQGKPVIELVTLENFAVRVPTRKEYDTLMQICESGNFRWSKNESATECDYWRIYENKTIITMQNILKYDNNYDNKEWYKEYNWKIRSLPYFCNIQKITSEIINKLNHYYDKSQPYRASKGK